MLNKVLNLLAPHHCYGCQKIGTLLCDNCKYNISEQPFSGCLVCRTPADERGVCGRCRVPYQRAWCVGERVDELARLIDGYKFNRQTDAAHVLADLLVERLPLFEPDVVVVPIPTIAPHIRQRGLDHTRIMAVEIAKRRGLTVSDALRRRENSVQRQASKKQRRLQAQRAYRVEGALLPETTYLLVDDVFTTGATLTAAAEVLQAAGAERVWVAVGARQPLDDKR